MLIRSRLASSCGVRFRTDTVKEIPDEGGQIDDAGIRFRVTEVHKSLLSVTKMMDVELIVIFEKRDDVVVNSAERTDKFMRLVRRVHVYMSIGKCT